MSEQETDMMALLQRMQQQLTFLEKKLDTLLQQSQQAQARPFDRPKRPFSRPFRPHGRPNNRPDGGYHGGGSREGNFAPKKKPFFGQGRHS